MLNGHSLTTWEKGDRLTAEGLNGNFLKLYELVIEALTASKMPDPANVALEMKTGQLAGRVDALENLTAMHAHQRNEKQYVPLSYLGAMVTQVNDLRGDVEDAIRRTDETHTALGVDHDDLHRRLLRVEQYPDSPSKEQFAALVGDHKRLAAQLETALAEIVELRHELNIVRNIAQGNDREANRMQYAPLAYVGQLLMRIEKLEARNG